MCYPFDMCGRRDSRRATLAAVLAIIGAAACGSSSPAAELPASHPVDASVPPPVAEAPGAPASTQAPQTTSSSEPRPLARPGCNIDFADCAEAGDGEAATTSEPSSTAAADTQSTTTDPSDSAPPTTGQVTVHLRGFRNHTGKALLALFTSRKGYPEKGKLAFKRAAVPIRRNAAQVVFRDVPVGEFAVVVLHDENGNKKMDKNFLGMPQEGWGVSRNPKTRMRPPNWAESALRLDAGARVRVDIEMKYL